MQGSVDNAKPETAGHWDRPSQAKHLPSYLPNHPQEEIEWQHKITP